MTVPVIWQPTLAALEAARATATGVRKAQAGGVATRLRSTGLYYDFLLTPEAQTQRDRELADFTARQRAELSRTQPLFEAIDAEFRVLDPLTDAPIQLTGPETPRTAATARFGGLRVSALEPGTFGNAIVVGLSTASIGSFLASQPPLFADVIAAIQASGLPEDEEERDAIIAGFLAARALQTAAIERMFAITVSRGSQFEKFDNLAPGTVPQGSTLVTFEKLSDAPPRSGRLSGGAGGSYSALTARLDRVAGKQGQASVKDQRERLARLPRIESEPRSSGRDRGMGWYESVEGGPVPTLEGVEEELVRAIGEAAAWLA